MKTCFKCQLVKPAELFYKHPRMADGRLGKCIDCAILDVKANYRKHRRKYRLYERLRSQDPERKKHTMVYARRRDPIKRKAAYITSNAIRDGRLVRGSCEVSGCRKKPQAHHDDYGKPLDVRWLCFKHHRELHGQRVGA